MLTSVLSVPMPGEPEARAFKASFSQGESLYQAGEFGAAIYQFRLADRYRVTPEVAFDLAKCHEKLGDVAMAAYYYRLYVKRAPQAADAFQIAGRVGALLSKARADNRGYFELEAPGAAAVTVNGKRFAEPPVALFLPQGEYDVSADFPSGMKQLHVSVTAGEATSSLLEPVLPPLVTAEVVAPEAAVSVKPVPAVGPSKLRIASYVVAAVGLVALGTATILGVSANADAELSRNRMLTVNEAQNAAASSNGKATGANVLFGVGGAAVAAGAVMFVVSMPEPGMKQETAR